MVDGCRPGDGVNKRRASSEEGGVVINDGNEEEGVVGIEGRARCEEGNSDGRPGARRTRMQKRGERATIKQRKGCG